MFFLKEVSDPERFGVAEIKDSRIVSIEEKPEKPRTNLAVTGLYLYDESVYERIKILKPSARGELEVTDLNNSYVGEKKAGYKIIKGFWSDAGTFPSRKKCSEFVARGLEDKILRSISEEIRKKIIICP